MRDFQLRTDLQRVVIRGFALPLGIAPSAGKMEPPVQGYTVAFTPGEDDEPDTYSFHIVVSHERLAGILHRAFELLPDEVFAIVEIGSRDAYRSTDTFMGEEAISRDDFLDVWDRYEPFLLEDGSIAAGANSDDPFVEVFVDQWKGLSIHVPPAMREEVEALLHEFDLDEVQQTWPSSSDQHLGGAGGGGGSGGGDAEDAMETSQIRPVLDLSDDYSPDVDELLLNLRHEWKLSLNVDPDSNVDEGGRNLGTTLWHAVVIVDSSSNGSAGKAMGSSGTIASIAPSNGEQGAYASIWATASSLAEMERLIGEALDDKPEWMFGEIYTIDRVAFDERPDELADLPPNRRSSQIHLVTIESWGAQPKPPEPPKTDHKKKKPKGTK